MARAHVRRYHRRVSGRAPRSRAARIDDPTLGDNDDGDSGDRG